MEYKFERLKKKHIKECIDILGNKWDLGKTRSNATGNICAKIYMLDILIYTTDIIVCTHNNEVIGLAGYYKYNEKRHYIRRKLCNVLKNMVL